MKARAAYFISRPVLLLLALMGTSGATEPAMPAVKAEAFHLQMDRDMQAMMQSMHASEMTGNPDIDVAAMMIPHHQGAIDMARLQLQYGTDPVMRRLAQEIIVTQQSEIELMRKRIKELQTNTPAR